MIVIVEAFNGGFLDGTVHPFYLPICPGMIDLGETMFNVVFVACTGEDMVESIAVTFPIGELNAVICKNGVDFIRNSLDELVQERSCLHLSG